MEDLSFLAVMVAMATVGALILSRLPKHPIGRIFLGIGAIPMVGSFGESYSEVAILERPGLPGGVPIAMLAGYWFPVLFTLLVFLFLLFPTGRHLSERWRWVARFAVVWFIVGLLHLVQPGRLGNGTLPVQNPLGVDAVKPYFDTFSNIWFSLTLLGLLAAIISMIVRFRRSRGEERQQLKWFGYGAAALGIDLLVDGLLLDTIVGIDSGVFGDVVAAASFMFIPVGAGIGIFRYRLYDIDIVINKTVVYGALAAFITAVYAGIVVGIGSLVGAGGEPNLGLSLAATAIVAVAFQPVRQRVQRFANKLVYGERVTPYEAVTSFSHRMAESLSLDQVLPQMAEAAAKGVGGIRSRVKLSLPGGGEQVITWPDGSSENSFDRTLAVMHQGEQVGEISVSKGAGEQFTKGEEKLLNDLASQAGLVMRNLRLTGELQQRLVELQESRKRIVAAQDEERRRMERDIHDGAQQHLVSMAVKLGLAKNILARDPQKASALLEEVKKTNDEAVETLRDLARGLFPQILTERGLPAALHAHVAKAGLGARVESERLAGARFDIEVEANVFFCIREAIQNATKHAPGAPITVRLSAHDGWVAFSVIDQGPGFDPSRVRLGSGLQNMKDRMEALGGTLEVVSSPGSGTQISGRVPAPSLMEAR